MIDQFKPIEKLLKIRALHEKATTTGKQPVRYLSPHKLYLRS